MGFLGDVVRWFASGEHWTGDTGIIHRLVEHVLMSTGSVLVAAALALPLGIWLGHTGRGGAVAVNLSNVGRAIPSFAILVVAAQVVGIGWKPAFAALVALGVPPMVTNAYVGLREVDPGVREAARGVGMTGQQSLWRIELPVALPLVMAGVRTAAVQVVATATLAALVACGGLGRFIVDGISQRDFVQVFAGAVLVAALSIVTELILAGLQRAIVPTALRQRESGKNEPFAGLVEGELATE
jgi:osmoprotectant transport system permease protein